jgi:hypothetical protein
MVVSKELMRSAKGMIKRGGWAQGDKKAFAEDNAFGYCVATACVASCQHERISTDNAREMVLLFKDANGIDENMAIGEWNDAPERTKDEVMEAFDRAIARSAQGGNQHYIDRRASGSGQ